MNEITLTTPDRRMLEVIDLLKDGHVIKYKKEFYDAAGIHKQNIKRIREGLQHFTAVQIAAACAAFAINANWILGLSDKMFERASNKNSNRKLLKEGVFSHS